MSGGRLLIPNLGAEEGPGWRRLARAPAVRTSVRLWRMLFGPDHELPPDLPHPSHEPWPAALGPAPESAVFPWLDSPEPATAWLGDAAAAAEAADAGRGLDSAPPDLVRAVHDKAFTREVAARDSLEPAELRGLLTVFEPDELCKTDTIVERMLAIVAGWPSWTGRNFTVKPRLGSSGRGRVGGFVDRLDGSNLRGALPRLAERGGAVLEPWLRRRRDLSSQMWISPQGELTLLGTLEQRISASGVFEGHRGVVDSRGRVSSGTRWDGALRDAAVALGMEARDRGFFGPCGVDALVFEVDGGREILWPSVELNARFTIGTVTLGLVRRALPAIIATLGLSPGELRGFRFALREKEPAAADNATELDATLGAPGECGGPRLIVGPALEDSEAA